MRQKRTRLQETPATDNIFYQEPTFLEHVYELRGRLFWIVATILLASCAAYPVHDAIISILTAPLGDQQLYYLTPVGGLTFIIKICTYVGVVVALPVIMYHLYEYLQPLMGAWRRSVVFYTTFSTFLAAAGMLFAYLVFLPGALRFLTGFDVGHIQAMLTVDSYLSFVITYLVGAAILFQIPLIMLIINTIKPMPPRKLLGFERYVILIAFVLAAVISPTPDVMNQTLFALPIIVMYQVGVGLVWLQQRSRQKQLAVQPGMQATQGLSAGIPDDVLADLAAQQLASLANRVPAQPEVKNVAPTRRAPAAAAFDITPPHQPPRALSAPKPLAPPIVRPTPRKLQVPSRRQVDSFYA